MDGRGLEISPENVSACLARGLAVVQGDADRDLDDFPDRAFDYAILSQTLQAVREPAPRAGRAAADRPSGPSSPSRTSATGGCGWTCSLHGRMPVTGALPEPWWATPNIHLCTLRDFTVLCRELDLVIEACAALSSVRAAEPDRSRLRRGNWRAELALFLLRRRGS